MIPTVLPEGGKLWNFTRVRNGDDSGNFEKQRQTCHLLPNRHPKPGLHPSHCHSRPNMLLPQQSGTIVVSSSREGPICFSPSSPPLFVVSTPPLGLVLTVALDEVSAAQSEGTFVVVVSPFSDVSAWNLCRFRSMLACSTFLLRSCTRTCSNYFGNNQNRRKRRSRIRKGKDTTP